MKQANDYNSAASPRIPPGNFNLIDHPFRPSQDFQPIPGFSEMVQALEEKKRFRSALDEIFKVLDSHPGHPEAMMLAMILLGESRTNRLHAEEPIPEAYLFDTRLDSIYAVCSHCRRKEWVPEAIMAVMNPVGLQCYNCGYVVCRDCLQDLPSGIDVSLTSRTCPNCLENALDVPVFPTGRRPHQMTRDTASIVHVVIFREGPVPPDNEYIQKLLEMVSPDILGNIGVGVTAFPVPSWSDDIDRLADAVVMRMEADGKLPPGSIGSIEHAHVQDIDGIRSLVVKVFNEGITQVVEHTIDENLLRAHIASLYQAARDMPGLLHLCDALIRPDVFSFTVSTMEKLLPLSIQNNKHQYLSQRFSETIIVISVVPTYLPSQAMAYFPGGYLATLITLMQEFGFGNDGSLDFVHWILCMSRISNEQMLHTSLFSPHTTTANLAQDLLSVAEKEQAGI